MQMAVSLPSPLGLTSKTLDSSSSFSKPQLLCFQCHHHRQNRALLRKFAIGPSQLKLSPINKCSFKAYSLRTDGAAEERDGKPVLNLKKLFKVYREAIFYGDEKVMSEIEARISIIENERSELAEKVTNLLAELTSGKEKYIRLQADFDNFRKRSDKERLNVRNDAVGEVIESLLPMIDSFERARQHIKPGTEMEKKIDTSYQGIYKQFVEIMKYLKVASVPTVGKPFDPSVHEAIAREESLEYKEGIVIQEFRRGFLLGDRLLRPATVKVSIGPGNKRATLGATESSGNPASTAGVE